MSTRIKTLDALGREVHSLIFEVPGEPRGKGRPRAFAYRPKGKPFLRAGLYADKKTITYEALVAASFAAAFPDWEPTQGEVVLEVEAYLQIPLSAPKGKRAEMLADLRKPTRKPDGPNILCAISDGLNGVAYRDDAQQTDSVCHRHFSERPHAVVLIRAVTTAGNPKR
jgi:Holliday junction resolvase RusA-like endonuclease